MMRDFHNMYLLLLLQIRLVFARSQIQTVQDKSKTYRRRTEG